MINSLMHLGHKAKKYFLVQIHFYFYYMLTDKFFMYALQLGKGVFITFLSDEN